MKKCNCDNSLGGCKICIPSNRFTKLSDKEWEKEVLKPQPSLEFNFRERVVIVGSVLVGVIFWASVIYTILN